MDDDGIDSSLLYNCSQLFGYRGRSEKIIEEDVITAVRFDHTGHYLAVGDRAGRVIMFSNGGEYLRDYQYYFQFQSHQRQFDRLKNVFLTEQIKEVRWMAPQSKYQKLITANSHSIKLWKLFEKREKKIVKSAGKELNMPKMQQMDPEVVVNLKKIFPEKHLSPINSVSIAKNEQFILSTDSSQAFIWSLEDYNRPFMVKHYQNTDSITCSVLHPDRDDMFICGRKSGNVTLSDLREGYNNQNQIELECGREKQQSNFVQDAISRCSAAIFLADRRQIAARDLISVRIWDIRSSRQPLDTILIDEKIRSKLSDLFQAECLDDSFSLSQCPKSGNLLTGNYSNSFHVIAPASSRNLQYELDYAKKTKYRQVGSKTQLSSWASTDKVLVHDTNPTSGQIAAGSLNCFFIYSSGKAKSTSNGQIQENLEQSSFILEEI